ncbi:MAG TPA: acetylneuraminic acid synthetase [Flavobacteriales bacterium]|nr:acetylneuraminic acid synthetase [Flavobacteriales bacterium]
MKINDIFYGVERDNSILIPPYVIAEAGVNHEGDMSLARRLIDEAAEAGANAIKFQTYKAGMLASKNSPSYWDTTKEPTKSQFELFSKYDKFWKPEYEELKKQCDIVDIEFMSTPFDLESACFLSDLVDVFKISSSDITNKPFIKTIAGYGKPIILSTGASSNDEISEALEWIGLGKIPVALLHCVLNYPTSDGDSHLGMILGLRKQFPNVIVGYSDHTMPGNMKNLEIATLLGAQIIEKHFTHDKSLQGNDHYHAMDKNDLRAFFTRIEGVQAIIGQQEKEILDIEQSARLNARRSLVARRQITQGSAVSEADLTWKRPAHGVSPKYFDEVVGRIAAVTIEEDDIITWDMLN